MKLSTLSIRQYGRASIVVGTLIASGAISAVTSPRWSYGDTPARSSAHVREAVTLAIGDSVFVGFFVRDSPPHVFPGGATFTTCGAKQLYARFYRDRALNKPITGDSIAVTIPCAAPIGSAAQASQVLGFSGPTVPVVQVPRAFASYEARFRAYADTQWNTFGPRWDAGNSIAGYERAAIYYTWWARTGDTTYLSRAHQTAINYRDNYLIPAGYGTSPHWSQMESLYLDWLVTGDTASGNAVLQVAEKFSAFLLRNADGTSYITRVNDPNMDQRIQARVIASQWMAEKVTGQPSVRLDTAIAQTLSTFNSDGWAVTAGACNGSVNYMVGMVYDALTRIYDQRPGPYNPAILSEAKAAGNYLWTKQWRGTANPADPSFNYLSVLCTTNPNGGGSPTAAPDLNGLILPLFGWLGKTTGDATWFTRGDQILSGMQGASIYLYRQFSESYSSSFRYFGYRAAAIASGLVDTTKTPPPLGSTIGANGLPLCAGAVSDTSVHLPFCSRPRAWPMYVAAFNGAQVTSCWTSVPREALTFDKQFDCAETTAMLARTNVFPRTW